MNGMLTIYKEKGYTSMDVVAKLRGILRERKIGHTGTLDPDATGVLPVCIGNATKLCDMLTDRDKEYVAVMRLGVSTDTQDMSGKVLQEREVTCDASQVRDCILSFVGIYHQVPPMYSALKVQGQKLCDLARKGIEVERKSRPVEIYRIDIQKIALPEIELRVLCSKGTYIRTLCADIGEKLGCGGAMESLVRTYAAGFELKDALKLDEVEKLRDAGEVENRLIPVEAVFAELSMAQVKPEYEKLLQNGNKLKLNQVETNGKRLAQNQQIRMYHADQRFCGVFIMDGEELKPFKIFEL